tara:strand:+ start:631 stop:1440 length:810 start_codon:yes stop_codon:yes gene_type:complete
MNFLKRYKDLFNKDLSKYESLKLNQCIRVNSLKINQNSLRKRLEKKGVKLNKFQEDGYEVLRSKIPIGATPEYLEGLYYIQEKASQYPILLLNPQPGELILDMTASPGGKTTQISQFMDNKGIIIALDIKTRRLNALKNNVQRMGCTNVIIYNKDARYIEDFKLKFDKVLLDAPCSGNFITDKNWLDRRTLDDIKSRQKIQRQLICAGISVLKPGGTLVYSTCSFEPEENEDIIKFTLKEFSNIKLEESERFWPPETQGFYVAKLKKLI